MLVAFEGNLGAGKTLGMTVFAWYFSLECGTNVISNLPLRPEAFAKHQVADPDFWLGYLQTFSDFTVLAEHGGGIIAWDEFHLSVDSRSWARKTQVYTTEFLMYLRKLNSPLFFTSQSVLNQIDVRVRRILDAIIVCRKTAGAFIYDLYDAVTYVRRRRFVLPKFFVSKFFSVYDSYRICRPVEFPTTDRTYMEFLDKLEKAMRGSREVARRDIPLDEFFKVRPKHLGASTAGVFRGPGGHPSG